MVKLNDVNTMDIPGAIRLGCRTMCSVFDAEDKDIPRFGASVRPELRLGGAHESHVPGRHLNALLNAEDATGIEVDEQCIEKHARAAFFSYSGTVPLPLHRDERNQPPLKLRTHNIREGFHALYALAKYRNSDRARELAEGSIAAIFEYWDPDGDWDYERLGREHGLKFDLDKTFIVGLARSIGPLVKYYRATGYGPALELAIVLKEKAINEFFSTEGLYDMNNFGDHTHSTTSVMSSLAQLADLTCDSVLMGRVRAFYDNGLWELRDELGWSIESTARESDPDSGEANNTGDIVETALILGRWGFTDYYHDAERILRCHLLPSQLRDISFVVDPPVAKDDSTRDVADRLKGAFGFPAPYGHEPIGSPHGVRFNLDIVGGAVGSLSEAYRGVTRFDGAGHWVNLLFDHETPAIKVKSPYTDPTLRIRVKRPGPLFVRMPPWVDQQHLRIEGVVGTPRSTNGYLLFPNPPVNRVISLEFPLADSEVKLKHQTRDIRARLRGDEVVSMDNFGADLTFFDPIE